IKLERSAMLDCSGMAVNKSPPDYDLADRIALTRPSQVKAISHPLRTTILGLLHERAATVTELAVAIERPKSTVAHHVKVLTDAGLVQVVRTRRVRAIEERFYGRTARMFFVGVERSPDGDDLPRDFNDFEVAVGESAAAYRNGKLWGFIRHARISATQASAFWERMAELVAEFDQLPRSGETMYGFAVGVYPTVTRQAQAIPVRAGPRNQATMRAARWGIAIPYRPCTRLPRGSPRNSAPRSPLPVAQVRRQAAHCPTGSRLGRNRTPTLRRDPQFLRSSRTTHARPATVALAATAAPSPRNPN